MYIKQGQIQKYGRGEQITWKGMPLQGF